MVISYPKVSINHCQKLTGKDSFPVWNKMPQFWDKDSFENVTPAGISTREMMLKQCRSKYLSMTNKENSSDNIIRTMTENELIKSKKKLSEAEKRHLNACEDWLSWSDKDSPKNDSQMSQPVAQKSHNETNNSIQIKQMIECHDMTTSPSFSYQSTTQQSRKKKQIVPEYKENPRKDMTHICYQSNIVKNPLRIGVDVLQTPLSPKRGLRRSIPNTKKTTGDLQMSLVPNQLNSESCMKRSYPVSNSQLQENLVAINDDTTNYTNKKFSNTYTPLFQSSLNVDITSTTPQFSSAKKYFSTDNQNIQSHLELK